jgi:5-methyltetrahydropteroyltriglutamate--homocysteine methyltransferase
LVEFHSTCYDKKWAHMAMNPPFHADHVGSLRRPQPLIEAHSSSLQGKLNPQALKELEDKAIDDAIAMQVRVGLQAITDGEIRRSNWRDRFFERVDGFSREKIASSFVFTDYSGKQYTGMPIPVVVGKLQWRESLTADDFDYLKAHTKRTAKATLPSPSANHFFSGDKSLTQSPYKDRKTFFADVCAIYRREIADLGRRGCTYLQLDEVPIAVLCDPANQARVRERGENSDELIDDYIDAINDAVRDRPAGMTICVHLCRGNQGQGKPAVAMIRSPNGCCRPRTSTGSFWNTTPIAPAASPRCAICRRTRLRCWVSSVQSCKSSSRQI